MGSPVTATEVAKLLNAEQQKTLSSNKNSGSLVWVEALARELGYDAPELKSAATAKFSAPKMFGVDFNPVLTQVVNKTFDLKPSLKSYRAMKTVLGYQMVLLEQRIIIAAEKFLLESHSQSEFVGATPTTVVRVGLNYGSGNANETLKSWIVERFGFYLNKLSPGFKSSEDDDIVARLSNSEISDETVHIIISPNVNRALMLHFFSYEFPKLKLTAPPYKHKAKSILPDDSDVKNKLGSYGIHHLSHLDETGYAPDGADEASSLLPFFKRRVRAVGILEMLEKLLEESKLQLKPQYYALDAIACSVLFERWYDASDSDELSAYGTKFQDILDNLRKYNTLYDLDQALSSVFLSDYIMAPVTEGGVKRTEVLRLSSGGITLPKSAVFGMTVGERYLMMRTLELGLNVQALYKTFIFKMSSGGLNVGKIAATDSLLSGMLSGRLLSSQLHTQRALTTVLMNDSSVYSRP